MRENHFNKSVMLPAGKKRSPPADYVQEVSKY